MKKQRQRGKSEDVFSTPELPSHIFRASDITRILGIEKWRLEKFLTGKQYRLSPSGHIGTGRGSWRLFSHEDLYRLAIASRMVEDGFTAKFVSIVLQEIDDNELLDINEHGESTALDVGVFRTDEGPQVRFAGAFTKQQPYYLLPLRELIQKVNKRIAERKER
jgi:hypothetical protein